MKSHFTTYFRVCAHTNLVHLFFCVYNSSFSQINSKPTVSSLDGRALRKKMKRGKQGPHIASKRLMLQRQESSAAIENTHTPDPHEVTQGLDYFMKLGANYKALSIRISSRADEETDCEINARVTKKACEDNRTSMESILAQLSSLKSDLDVRQGNISELERVSAEADEKYKSIRREMSALRQEQKVLARDINPIMKFVPVQHQASEHLLVPASDRLFPHDDEMDFDAIDNSTYGGHPVNLVNRFRPDPAHVDAEEKEDDEDEDEEDEEEEEEGDDEEEEEDVVVIAENTGNEEEKEEEVAKDIPLETTTTTTTTAIATDNVADVSDNSFGALPVGMESVVVDELPIAPPVAQPAAQPAETTTNVALESAQSLVQLSESAPAPLSDVHMDETSRSSSGDDLPETDEIDTLFESDLHMGKLQSHHRHASKKVAPEPSISDVVEEEVTRVEEAIGADTEEVAAEDNEEEDLPDDKDVIVPKKATPKSKKAKRIVKAVKVTKKEDDGKVDEYRYTHMVKGDDDKVPILEFMTASDVWNAECRKGTIIELKNQDGEEETSRTGKNGKVYRMTMTPSLLHFVNATIHNDEYRQAIPYNQDTVVGRTIDLRLVKHSVGGTPERRDMTCFLCMQRFCSGQVRYDGISFGKAFERVKCADHHFHGLCAAYHVIYDNPRQMELEAGIGSLYACYCLDDDDIKQFDKRMSDGHYDQIKLSIQKRRDRSQKRTVKISGSETGSIAESIPTPKKPVRKAAVAANKSMKTTKKKGKAKAKVVSSSSSSSESEEEEDDDEEDNTGGTMYGD